VVTPVVTSLRGPTQDQELVRFMAAWPMLQPDARAAEGDADGHTASALALAQDELMSA
jgi:hypothetical protein